MKKIFLAYITLILMACTQQASDNDLRMVVGTYTDTDSYGLYSFIFNEETGNFHKLDSCDIVNPSYLTFSEDCNFLYSVSETDDSTSSVYALSFNIENGAFSLLNSQNTEGTSPCYVATNGKVVVTANYGGSMSVFPIESDGKLAPISQFFEGSVGGPDSIRQNTPHVHCTEFSVDGKHLFASDFSADRLLVFRVEEEGNRIEPLVTDSVLNLAIELDPDDGPRHVIFDKSGLHAYVIGELSGKITVIDRDGECFKVKQVVDADPAKGRGSADIHISPDGRFLYASNRLINDGISIFKINERTGELTPAGYKNTGTHPRNFAITPNGRFLLCACRDSDEIQIFKIDKTSGWLNDTGKSIRLPHPVCVKFAVIPSTRVDR